MKYIASAFVALALCISAAWAGDFEDGVAAYEKKDFATALRKFKSAAAKGNAGAQLRLGIMYDGGEGVVQDDAEAMRWYKLAAAQGLAGAQLMLGVMYDGGKGVVQDYSRAHMWFNLAAATGVTVAGTNRDIIAAKMTTQQIVEAQKLGKECQARNFKNCD